MGKNNREYALIVSLCIAFAFGWLVAYGNSVFFNPKMEMDQRISLSSMGPIGGDIFQLLGYSRELQQGKSPYVGSNFYTPLVSVLALPLLYVTERNAFLILSLLTISSMFGGLAIAEKFVSRQKDGAWLVIFFFVTTLLSYGFEFEIERGQQNVITAFFAILAVALFKADKRILAALALTMAIQLKLSPVIFSLLLISYPLFSKKNLFMILGTGLLNGLLLFSLGSSNFFIFLEKITAQFSKPFLWVGNHSLFAYCSKVTVGVCEMEHYPYAVGLSFIMLGIALFMAWKQKLPWANPYFVALCGMFTLVIPSVSHDYTLAMSGLYLLAYFKELAALFMKTGNWLVLGLFIVSAWLYTQLLFSFNFAWPLFPISVNKAPPLYLLLIVIFCSFCVYSYLRRTDKATSE